MEKQPKVPFAKLDSSEDMKRIYRETYLECGAGDGVNLTYFRNFEMDWNEVVDGEAFRVFHTLGEGKTLRYTCRLENQAEAKNLFNQISERTNENSSAVIRKLEAQRATIVAVDILES